MLSKKAIDEFKQIYKRNYKIDLTNKEAAHRAGNLVALYKAVYGGAYFGRIKNEQQESVNKTNN